MSLVSSIKNAVSKAVSAVANASKTASTAQSNLSAFNNSKSTPTTTSSKTTSSGSSNKTTSSGSTNKSTSSGTSNTQTIKNNVSALNSGNYDALTPVASSANYNPSTALNNAYSVYSTIAQRANYPTSVYSTSDKDAINNAIANQQSVYSPTVTSSNNDDDDNVGYYYAPQAEEEEEEEDNTYDYASAMLDALKAQYDAQEKARLAKLEALYKSNRESADRQIGLYNNQANKNNRQISAMTKNGTNGAMLSQQLQNNLWRDNGIHSTLNTMNTANANGESASYDTQAENLGNLTSNINSIASNYLANMDADSQRKFISRLEDLYK